MMALIRKGCLVDSFDRGLNEEVARRRKRSVTIEADGTVRHKQSLALERELDRLGQDNLDILELAMAVLALLDGASIPVPMKVHLSEMIARRSNELSD